jgi:hypothetical protein
MSSIPNKPPSARFTEGPDTLPRVDEALHEAPTLPMLPDPPTGPLDEQE